MKRDGQTMMRERRSLAATLLIHLVKGSPVCCPNGTGCVLCAHPLCTTRAGSLPLVFVPLLAEGRDPTTAALFSPAEQAALAYATDVTAVGARVADATFASLRRHFSEREIVELTVAIAAENMFNRLNAPLEIESQGFCALPARR